MFDLGWIKAPEEMRHELQMATVSAQRDIAVAEVKSANQPALRDQFAMAALTGLLSHKDTSMEASAFAYADRSFEIADAMMAARGERDG